jgi:hypothetical protein
MDNATEHALVTDAIAVVRGLGLDFALTRFEPQAAEWGADARLRLRCGGQEVQYLAKVKRGLRPATGRCTPGRLSTPWYRSPHSMPKRSRLACSPTIAYAVILKGM